MRATRKFLSYVGFVIFIPCVSAMIFVSPVASAALPDRRGYELVTPIEKNGVSPYAGTPSSAGQTVDFQARGALAGATWGSLTLYQAQRTTTGWKTASITPQPIGPLGALEEQAPVWLSSDLSQAIFTTPEPFASGDEDSGALSLYARNASGELSWLSRGSQGGAEPNEATFDSATPDGNHVVFSTSASLLPEATGLGTDAAPEAEYLYERDAAGGQTHLLNVDSGGQLIGSVATTLPEGYKPGVEHITVNRTTGLFPGQFITVGTGESAITTAIDGVRKIDATTEQLNVENNSGLPTAYPPGTPVVRLSEGAILGNGGHLTSGLPPAGEYLPANAGSGSTTHAISMDGSKTFFESPNPLVGEPVGLYMRQDNTATVKIAGSAPDGTTLSGLFDSETVKFGSARYEGAAADGSLAFFTSDEGIAGATQGQEVYEFNTTGHEIGGVAPSTVGLVSAGLDGDSAPATTLTEFAPGHQAGITITVASTAGFHVGEAIAFAPFEALGYGNTSDAKGTVAAVKSATELTLTGDLVSVGAGVPAGTEVHGVHPASVVAIANDGSRVYFVSDGVLASNLNAEGTSPVPVQPNLYVFDTGADETTFVGTLASSDVSSNGNPAGLVGEPDISRPTVPSPDGGVLVFASAANLTGQNPWQEFTQIYRYSVTGNTLTCLSCTAPGIKPTGNATFGETAGGTYGPPGLTSPMSEDGSRVFFQTPDSLVPEDENGGAPLSAKFETPTSTDVYEWEAGKVSLISSGTATTPTVLQGTTPSGDDVLFTSTAQLVPGQSDGGYENVFDARVGGGFPEAAHAEPSCVGSGCRAAFGVAPSFEAPASTSPQGPGNAPTVLGAKKTLSPLEKKLAKTLKLCSKKKPASVRARCEAKAHRAYKKAKKASKRKSA